MTDVYSTKGDKVGDLQLPQVFSTPFRHDLIHRIYTIQTTHSFQPKGTHPTAGMDVSADSLDPPTGHGQSRVARINAGGAGGRGGQGGEVASTRGGRQAHPPNVEKGTHGCTMLCNCCNCIKGENNIAIISSESFQSFQS